MSTAPCTPPNPPKMAARAIGPAVTPSPIVSTLNGSEAVPVVNHNSKTDMSSLNPPVVCFPNPLRSPKGLPIRFPALEPKLKELDEVFNKVTYPKLSGQGKKCGGYDETQDESRNKEAMETLNAHITARTPYVQLASSRLQAACGIRNETVFDLPELPKGNLSPGIRALYNMPNAGFATSSADKGGVKSKSTARGEKSDSGIGFVPKSPIGMQAVDKNTGKGLREFLLQKGKECGMRKHECNNITFYDFTPDLRTGAHSNVLLGHYGASNGERVDVYEVDLPAIHKDATTGEEFPTTETWIWILISRPLVSFDLTDTSTFVAPKSPSFASPATDIFHTSHSTFPSEPTTVHSTPPNFPHPTPQSWIVFAAPKAHVTRYPQTIEKDDGSLSRARYPFAAKSSKVTKRTDYDFSFAGVPLFEFSSIDIFTAASTRTEFLSIEAMGAWSDTDPYTPYSEDEYARMFSLWEDGEWGLIPGGLKSNRFDKHGRPTAPIPPPNRGVWWKVFYERMAKDVERWEKIRTAMGRSKCRVVVRWTETVDEQGKFVDGTSSGKQFGDKKGALAKRLTRSETRRRSVLGVSETPVGLAIGGVVGVGAMGESTKSRAAGNFRAGIVGAEKEKSKVSEAHFAQRSIARLTWSWCTSLRHLTNGT